MKSRAAGAMLRACPAFLVIAAASCALNPVSGRPEFVVISAEKERELGRRGAEEVAAQIGVVEGTNLARYVAAIGQRLAEYSPRRDVVHTFQIVDMPEPNAFALPGGPVYVSRGLLAVLNSEDELAGVIGHEIGHIAARHSVRQMSRQAPLAVVTGIGALATGIVSPMLGRVVGGLGGLASEAIIAPYSRDQEREADRLGQELAARAGWDPSALSRALHTLEREEALHQSESRRPSFFDTHPATPERVANTTAYAGELTSSVRSTTALSPADFLRQLEGVVVGASAAAGVFEGSNFLHPDFDLFLTFPSGWQMQNARSGVAAAPADGGALLLLQVVAEGDDPMNGARALEKASGTSISERTQRVTINGLPAAQTRVTAEGRSGPIGIDVTWIAHHDRVFQIAGMTALGRIDSYKPTFEAVARSFRQLRSEERAGIMEVRLRIVRSTSGEGLDTLVEKNGSIWPAEMVAVANGIEAHKPLAVAQRIKIAVPEPYRAEKR